MTAVATVDMSRWRAGDFDAVGSTVDEGLQRAGFLLVTGHGVTEGLADRVREATRKFVALDPSIKGKYAAVVGGRGWIGPGLEANGYAEGTETPPDLKETFAVGAHTPIGDDAVDAQWFPANVWPTEVTELHELLTKYTTEMKSLADELLEMFAAALKLDVNPFATLADRSTWTCNVNHYPPMTEIGEPEPGQFRIGPHTDFGTVTILDREPGAGGLQVFTDDGGWEDAPFDNGALTVNIGDLLEYWSGRRWPSGRHRVLPPQRSAPDEDLVSLIFFYELNHDAVVSPLEPPIGRMGALPPVTSGAFVGERLAAITMTAP